VGGGSVFVTIRQKFPAVNVWINDLNFDLYCFWKIAQTNTKELTDAITKIKNETKDGRGLFDEFRNGLNNDLSDFDRAVRFFVLNRITFSGTVDSGGTQKQLITQDSHIHLSAVYCHWNHCFKMSK